LRSERSRRGAAIAVLAACLLAARDAAFPWPVAVDPTGRYLIDEAGKPFLWLGDTAWLLFQMPGREDLDLYLRTRARQGFTVIQAAIVMGEERVAGTTRPNAHGDTAFVEHDPGRPRLTAGQDHRNADEYDYWDHADHVIDSAAAHGLVLGLLPLFVGHRGDGYQYLKLSNAEAYGRFLGERYRAKPNIVWILGGDNVPDSDEKLALWNRLAKGLTEAVAGAEDYGKTLMTYHSPGGTSSSAWFRASPWLDFYMVQTWSDHQAIPSRLAADYALIPPRPTGLGEGAYEDGPQYGFRVDALSIRAQACRSYFSGGYHTYGNTNVWNFGSYQPEGTQDWKAALDSPGATHLSALRRILEAAAWWRFVPDASVFAKEAEGALAMRSTRGDAVIAYLAGGSTVTVRLDRITSPGNIRAAWIDPRTGERTEAGLLANRETSSFSVPAGREDAILLLALEAEPTAAPPAASGRRLFVAPDGDDARPGTPGAPLRTIQKAADLARAGDTVIVRAGVYREHVFLRFSGDPGKPIVLRNAPGERPIIDGEGRGRIELKSEHGWQKPIGWITVEGFEVRNGWDGIKFYNAHDIVLKGNDLHDNVNQGILGNGCRVRIEGNVIARNGLKPDNERSNLEHGIYGTGSEFTIVNNVIHSNRAYGIQVAGYPYKAESHPGPEFAQARRWLIAHNTIAFQGNRAGIVIWQEGAADCVIEGNIFYRNAVRLGDGNCQGVDFVGPGGGHVIRRNLFFAPGRVSIGESPGDHTAAENIEKDPLFADPERRDFRLRQGSPAIDVAPPNEAVATDLEGTPRPQGPGVDLGAYEHRR
jgi:hypothetical protein